LVQVQHRDVTTVGHVGDDELTHASFSTVLLHQGKLRRITHRVLGLLLVEPLTGDRVDPEPVRFVGFGAQPAQVDPVDVGGVPVVQTGDGARVVTDERVLTAQAITQVLETVGGDDTKTRTTAFLLVGGDLLPLGGVDGVQVQQAGDGALEGLIAQFAAVGFSLDGVMVAAPLATHRLACGEFASGVRGQLHTGDLVARALVVDQGTRAELTYRHETGPLQEITIFEMAPASGDVGGQGQSWEGVSGQEALGRKVAVGIEVAHHGPALPALVLEQQDLGLGLTTAVGGLGAVTLGQTVIEHPAVLFGLVDQCGPEQFAPAGEGGLETVGGVVDDAFQPVLVPPRHFTQVGHDVAKDLTGSKDGPLLGALVEDGFLDSGLQRKGGCGNPLFLVVGDVEDLGDGMAQFQVGLGQPDGLEVGDGQVLVDQVQAWRLHHTGDHQVGTAEVVLVVAVAGGAVGDDQGGLSVPAGAATALGVVGGGGWHVTHHDGV